MSQNAQLFESYGRRIDQINKVLNSYGIASIEEAKQLCDAKGVDVYKIVKAQGWKIRVDENPNGGSIFTITIHNKK